MLGTLSLHLLQFPAHQQVEPLVGAAELHVRPDLHRIVGLKQRVEQLSNGDGPLLLEPLGEVVTLQKLGHGELSGQPNHVRETKLAEPFTLPHHLSQVLVHNLKELAQVGLGVGNHLIVGQDRPGGRLAAWVADLGGPVSHDKNHLVAQLLELAQLAKTHHMAQVNVRPAGVKAHLQA